MIINSLLDNDLYKFTMQQAVFHQFPDVKVKYRFFCRNGVVAINSVMRLEIAELEKLSLLKNEYNYLKNLGYFSDDYLEFLMSFKFDTAKIRYYDKYFEIEGKWLDTILFEVPLLAIINALLYQNTSPPIRYDYEKCKIIMNLPHIKFADFGTRRRFSYEVQKEAIARATNIVPNNFIGTSNLHFAMIFNIKPIGTVAHEWFMACQSLCKEIINETMSGFEDTNPTIYAINKWISEYGVSFGIFLSDTLGTKGFFKDIDSDNHLFSGIRQDSGNPFIIGQMIVNWFKRNGIDPLDKELVFSDNLNFDTIMELWKCFRNQINVSFGIGTNFTNPKNCFKYGIIIKMVECEGKRVIKIPDDINKAIT